ncbi:MAG: D-alanyl-D-alanine carboxypeptidase [Oscillospiraceae bacterium]|nr:D-alanyl-D-alanine carboxypeptidase [Oscillospiraceae bacterium]
MSDHEAEPIKPPKKRGASVFNALYPPLLAAVLGGAMFLVGSTVLPHITRTPQRAVSLEPAASQPAPAASVPDITAEAAAETTVTQTETTALPAAEFDESLVYAKNALLLKLTDAGFVTLYDRGADEQIYPASMTKIMTLITFLDLVPGDKLNETITMDGNVIASQQAKYAYVAGFQPGEPCVIRDLIMAMMMPSGADAAVMLATYAAGDEASFVAKMNEKAQAMGLTKTHFVNCTGLHEDAHTSSVRDIAVILNEALKDPFCKAAMSTLKHTTAPTEQHPNGIELVSTTLSRQTGTELENLPVPLHLVGGKTGFTNPAGQCLATWAQDTAGNTYICIVAGSTTNEPLNAMGDVLTIYQLTSAPAGSVQRIQPNAADLPDYVHH